MSAITITTKIKITKSNNSNPLFSSLDFFLKNRFIHRGCKYLTDRITEVKCTKNSANVKKQNSLVNFWG